MKNLIVLIGAGASAGAVVPGINSRHGWAPPVTKDIFNIRFESILNKFGSVSSFAGINDDLANGADLEIYLNAHIGTHLTYSRLSDTRRRQINQLPLYLQDLFRYITDLFSATNYYRRLVDQLFESNIKVTFVTLNYDLLLDRAIEDASGIQLDNFANYFVNSGKWVLLKPHGSINWFRQIMNRYGQTGENFESWKAIVNRMNILTDLDKIIFHVEKLNSSDTNSFTNGFINNVPFYPALAIPNGEYEFIYPVDNYREILEKNLQESENYLLIGLSGYAKDLLKVLNDNVKSVRNLLIVGRSHVNDTYEKLILEAPVFSRDQWSVNDVKYGSGFENFVKIKNAGSDLENFLGKL